MTLERPSEKRIFGGWVMLERLTYCLPQTLWDVSIPVFHEHFVTCFCGFFCLPSTSLLGREVDGRHHALCNPLLFHPSPWAQHPLPLPVALVHLLDGTVFSEIKGEPGDHQPCEAPPSVLTQNKSPPPPTSLRFPRPPPSCSLQKSPCSALLHQTAVSVC